MNWKKFILLISSCTALAASIVIACADYTDPYDDYPSFFFSTINSDPAYKPFHFTTMYPYFADYWTEEDTTGGILPDQNLAAWYAFTDHKASLQDIDSFVYKYSVADLEKLMGGETSSLPAVIKNNSFAKWLMQQNDKEAITYLIFAKKCETQTQPLDEYYDGKTRKFIKPVRNATLVQELEKQGMDLLKTARASFIHTRYQYQMLRLAFYNNDNTTTLKLYTDFFNNSTDTSVIAFRCKGLYAGALFKTGERQQAAYIYSRLFDGSDELKLNAHISFNWATEGDIDSVLLFCKNSHERSVVYVMNGLYEHNGQERAGLSILEHAYKEDPAVRGLDIVMTRELNKAEQRYFANSFQNNLSDSKSVYDDSILLRRKGLPNEYTSYLKELNVFAQKVSIENKTGHTAYWQLASAYIYLMLGDKDNCNKYLGLAQQQNMTDMEHDEHEVINALCILRSDNKVTADVEARLLPSLKWIEQRTTKKQRFNQVYNDIMTKALTAAYLRQGDTIKAIYCLSRSLAMPNNNIDGYYYDGFGTAAGSLLEKMDPMQLNSVEAFVQGNKTPYENWLTSNSRYTMGVLQELEGTKYIRLHQFGRAAEILAKVPAAILNKTVLPDILVSHLFDSQDWNKSDSTTTYTKLTFARKMNELEQGMAKNPKDSRTPYQYANALYNITYYGKAWQALKYYRGGTENEAYRISKERIALKFTEQEYYNAHLPEQYYIQAFKNSTDPEFKARCLFLAAKCRQKNCPEPEHTDQYYYWNHENYYDNSLASPYFKQLKEGYSKTKFFNAAKNTCSYLGDYVKKH
ncbi:MAG: hypothetical protein P4L41_03585 [Flavipsychrobacter sp.]|nr:hypothetical protein [Flavipsychrobacter sp.]